MSASCPRCGAVSPADEEIVGVLFEGAAFYLMLSENAPTSASG